MATSEAGKESGTRPGWGWLAPRCTCPVSGSRAPHGDKGRSGWEMANRVASSVRPLRLPPTSPNPACTPGGGPVWTLSWSLVDVGSGTPRQTGEEREHSDRECAPPGFPAGSPRMCQVPQTPPVHSAVIPRFCCPRPPLP